MLGRYGKTNGAGRGTAKQRVLAGVQQNKGCWKGYGKTKGAGKGTAKLKVMVQGYGKAKGAGRGTAKRMVLAGVGPKKQKARQADELSSFVRPRRIRNGHCLYCKLHF